MGIGVINLDIGKALDVFGTVLDKIFPDKTEAEKAKAALVQLQISGQLEEFKQIMQVFVNESASQDKWTSRARPSFMYVMYTYILAGIPMGILTIFSKESALLIAQGMQAWMSSIPTTLWGVFGACFSVYTLSRSYDKSKGNG